MNSNLFLLESTSCFWQTLEDLLMGLLQVIYSAYLPDGDIRIKDLWRNLLHFNSSYRNLNQELSYNWHIWYLLRFYRKTRSFAKVFHLRELWYSSWPSGWIYVSSYQLYFSKSIITLLYGISSLNENLFIPQTSTSSIRSMMYSNIHQLYLIVVYQNLWLYPVIRYFHLIILIFNNLFA